MYSVAREFIEGVRLRMIEAAPPEMHPDINLVCARAAIFNDAYYTLYDLAFEVIENPAEYAEKAIERIDAIERRRARDDEARNDA